MKMKEFGPRAKNVHGIVTLPWHPPPFGSTSDY